VGVGELVLVGALLAVAAVQAGQVGGGRRLGRAAAAAAAEDRIGEGAHLTAGGVASAAQVSQVGVTGGGGGIGEEITYLLMHITCLRFWRSGRAGRRQR
jgi:hypothetical protein